MQLTSRPLSAEPTVPPTPALAKAFHITPADNIPQIVADGFLLSDALMIGRAHTVNGYANIKARRLREIRVPCCGGRFVGEFVPFYYCPRSPMLSTLNRGNVPGRPAGCQTGIVHLVTDVQTLVDLGSAWAISDIGAGSPLVEFYSDLEALKNLNWGVIGSNTWGGDRLPSKTAEFLVADRVPWTAIKQIGCYSEETAALVRQHLGGAEAPRITVNREWYYA